MSNVTHELLWDDDETGEGVTDVPQPTLSDEPPAEQEEEVEAAPEPDEDEGEQPEPDEEEEEEGEDESEEEAAQEELIEALKVEGFDVSDPEVKAFLAYYQNDPYKALQAAAHLRQAFDRQGTDLGAARARAAELERTIAQSRLLSGGAALSQEQHEWAESAAASPSPGAYVQQAIDAGEYDLARAVCTYWAREDPFNAGRVGQMIDGAESQAWQATQAPTEAPTELILDSLFNTVPGMRDFEPQMVSVFQNLGPTHHLVQEAKSNNIDTAMRALINIYEIAKASTASVQERRAEIKKKARADADGAKAKAAVTSGANTPGTSAEPPRSTQILPGLTLEDLDTEFASEAS